VTQAGGAWAALCAVVVAAWVAIALGGGDASPVTTTAAGAAAAAATAALLGAGWRVTSLGTLQTGGVLVLLLPAAAAGAVGGSTALLAVALGLLAAVEVAVASTARFSEGLTPQSGVHASQNGGWGRSEGRGRDGRPQLAPTDHADPVPDVPAEIEGDSLDLEVDPLPAASIGGDRSAVWAVPRRRRRPRRRRGRMRPVLEAMALVCGSALLAAGLVAERIDDGGWVLPGGYRPALGLLLVGAAVVVVTAALGPPRAWALAVPALAVALPIADHLPAGPGAAVAGGLAVAAALAVSSRPTVALGALAVAAAASSAPLGATASLLAAGAVLALAVDHRAAALLGLPGAAALATAVVPPGRSGPAVVVAGATAATALVLVLRAGGAPGQIRPPRPPLSAAPALVLAGWLLLAPGTWAWAGGDGTGAYNRGAAVAVAAAALAAATGIRDRLPADTPPAASAQPSLPADHGTAGPAVVPVPARRQGRLRPAPQRPEPPADG